MRNEHRVLTPESVEFVYELGGLAPRMLAALLDHLLVLALVAVLTLITLVVTLLTALLVFPAGIAGISLVFLFSFVAYFGYFTFCEWRWGGQTVGKRLLDLRVIDQRGMNIDLFQAVVRNLLRSVDMLPLLFAVPIPGLSYVALGFYGVGGVAAVLSRGERRLGDWAAGTLVVRVRKRVMPGEVLAPGEKYNSLLEDATVRSRARARLGLEELETLLQLCLRRNELEFEARQALFAQAASCLEQRLEVEREPFLSEEKFVQNITAAAMTGTRTRVAAARTP